MNSIIIVVVISIVFIAVFSSLSVLGTLASKYEQCKEHMFSETPQCNMTDLGKALSSGIMLVGLMAITSVGAAYVLLKVASRMGKQQPYQSGF
jgi:hypothetical protein